MMVKPALRWLLLGAVAVQAACAPTAAPVAQAPTPTPGVTLALPAPSATRPAPTATARSATATAASLDEPGGSPVPTPDSLFAPITDADWQKGPADARLTIIEYGDYQ